MRRRTLVTTACAAGIAMVATGGILLTGLDASPSRADADTVSQSIRTGAGTVEKGDLVGTTTKSGTLERPAGSTVKAGPSGTVTWLPDVGTVVKPGETLYRVDDTPVTFFAGALPQWRPFQAGMSDGPDVMQLEQNLHAQGFLIEGPTAHFDWRTTAAIRAWQKATGQERTGVVDMGRIWFGEGDQVVSDRSLSVGDSIGPGAPVYRTTGTTEVVTVDLPVGSSLAKVGGIVKVHLPNGRSAPGKAAEVGDPATDDSGKTTVPVTIHLDDPKQAAGLDQVDVTVDFVSETRKGVLSVPVTALGAKAGGGFVVDVIQRDGTTKRVPVTTGLFAGDRVQVTGSLEAGQKVVVPA